MRLFLGIAVVFVSLDLFAQIEEGQVLYHGGFDFKEGIYRTFEEFRNNAPYFEAKKITNKQGHNVADLYQSENKLYYPADSGSYELIDDTKIWGYCHRDAVHVRMSGGFDRIVVIGALCHFMGTITYYTNDPFTYYGNQRQTVPQQYVLDMESGGIYEFTTENMSALLDRDPVLLEQFEDLPKKQKKNSLFLFLRRYNERHALFFPAH